VLLVRNLRIALAGLRAQAKDDTTHDVEAFLARVSTRHSTPVTDRPS